MAESPVVAIDSMTLVWGVRKDGTEEQRNRARYLFQKLEEEDDAQIVVPAIVVAEYLVPVAEANRARVASALSERFRIVPFDVRSAALASRLFETFKPSRATGTPGARDLLKADTMIVASAKTAGAQVFYTDDEDCREMASTVLAARPLPNIPSSLFGY